MPIQTLTPDLSVSPQIQPEDVAAIAAAGFKTIVCNRPDREGGAEQPTFEQISQAAQGLGLSLHYVPVVSGQITEDDVRAFRTVLDSAPKPVLAYCRSGTRSTNLYALTRRGEG
ncbi:MAG: TIGR01244 family sulfur transferase [Burkholderiaceae bacterium]